MSQDNPDSQESEIAMNIIIASAAFACILVLIIVIKLTINSIIKSKTEEMKMILNSPDYRSIAFKEQQVENSVENGACVFYYSSSSEETHVAFQINEVSEEEQFNPKFVDGKLE